MDCLSFFGKTPESHACASNVNFSNLTKKRAMIMYVKKVTFKLSKRSEH